MARKLPGLRPSNLFREAATLRRHAPREFDSDYLETEASKMAAPTDTAIIASFQYTKDGQWEDVEVAGIRAHETRVIVTKTRLHPTISDTNQGLPDPDAPRQADQIIHNGQLWNVVAVKVHGAPHFLYEGLLMLAPTEDAR